MSLSKLKCQLLNVTSLVNARQTANLKESIHCNLKTLQTVAHEFGHNLGMEHDFDSGDDEERKGPRYDSNGNT